MIQRRQHAGFALESRHTFAVVTESLGKKPDGNTAAQLRVGSLIDLSHAARTQMAGDLVVGCSMWVKKRLTTAATDPAHGSLTPAVVLAI
jgi:hypothetical protein